GLVLLRFGDGHREGHDEKAPEKGVGMLDLGG
nr:hypothetical protein [Tanacetum cinerariifolium]